MSGSSESSALHSVLLSRRISVASILVPYAVTFTVLLTAALVGWNAGNTTQGIVFILLLFGGLESLLGLPFHALIESVILHFEKRKLDPLLLDEVLDCGGDLIVRLRERQERIRMSDILTTYRGRHMGLPCIWLKLRKDGAFGNILVFCPRRPSLWNPFAKDRIAEVLAIRSARASLLDRNV